MNSVTKPKRLYGFTITGRNNDRIREVKPSSLAETREKASSAEIFKRQTTRLKDICLKFLRTTSLHALKFIADNEITSGEKYFFSIAFLLAVVTSSYYITAIYYNWMESPIITATSSMPSSISTIPFPAITICNLNQARKSVVKGFKKNSLNYWRLQSLCKTSIGEAPPQILEINDEGTEYRDFILNVSQPCDDMLISCKFGSEIQRCKSLFQSVLTDEGQCCTFNAVDVKYMFFRGSDEITLSNWTAEGEAVDWTPEKGYGQKKSFQDYAKKVFPRPALGTGAHLGLSLVLNASLEEYFCSSGSSAGFKMMMHSPIETPKITNYGYLLSAGMESRIAINLEVQSAEPSIRSVEMKYRNCLFASESQLKFYRTYSKSNCELECELQRVLAICGCIPYYLPRMSDNVTICGLKDLNCTKNVQIASDNLMNMDVKCSLCPQACCSVNYLPVVTTNPLIYGNSYLEDGVHVQQRSELEELAVVHFFFEVNSFRAKTKEELSTFTDFLANSGGILGLFMGFSILAVIEFLYFVFLAPYCALKKLIMYRLEVRMVRANKAPQEKEENVRAIMRPSHFTYSDNNVDYAIARKNFKPRPLYSYYE